MNRAMRRAADRAKPIEHKRVDLPKYLDEFTIFSDIERVLEKLGNGEIEHVGGKAVFMASNGEWCQIVPALNGWISVWKRYDAQFKLNHDVSALVRVCNKLNYNAPLTEAQVKAAKDTVDNQRRLFRRLNRDQLASVAKTEQIAIFLEDKAAA